MSDFYGAITHVTLSVGIWVIPLAPLAAAAYALYATFARGMGRQRRSLVADGTIANVSVLAAALAFGWTAFQTLKLSALAHDERFLLEHVFRMARFGQLDIALDLAFDPLTAVIALAVSGVSLLVLVLARTRPLPPEFFSWASLLSGATLLVVVADGLVAVFIGWEVAALATWGLTRQLRGFVVARAADAGFLVGAAMLFWGLGGVWSDAEYTPDLVPRFAAVQVGANDAKEIKGEPDKAKMAGKGLLTMTSYPGALVFMDDSRTPLMNGDALLRAPFTRFPIPGGLHSFRVHPGGGLDDHLVSHVLLGRDREVLLGVFGASVTFAQMRDQLVVKSAHAESSLRATLLGRKAFAGVGLVTVACLLLFAAAGSRSAQAPLHGGLVDAASTSPLSGALLATTTSLLGVYLILRLGFLISLSGPASAVISCVGGVTAIVGAALAVRALDLRRVVLCLGVSDLGLGMLGAGSGAHAASALEIVTYAAGAGALWTCVFAVEQKLGTDLRKLGGLKKAMPAAARIWLVTAVVLFVASLPKQALLSLAFAAQATAPVPGWLLFVLGAVATGLASYAASRAYYLVFQGKKSQENAAARDVPGAANTVGWLLCGVAAAPPVALGLRGSFFGKSAPSTFSEWLEPLTTASSASFAPTSVAVEWSLAVVVVGLGLVGFSRARARYGNDRPDDWTDREPSSEETRPPSTKDTPAIAAVAVGVERWVLDGVYGAIGAAAQGLAALANLVDEKLLGAGIDALADRSARLDARVRAIGAAASIAVLALLLYLALRHNP